MSTLNLQWEQVASPPQIWTIERGGHTATRIGDKVYIIGGYSDDAGRDEKQPQYCLFNSNTNDWQLLEPIGDKTEVISYHSATLVDDRILLLGGFDEGSLTYFDRFHVRWYDPVLNTLTWVECKGKVPSSRFRHVAGWFEVVRELIVFGGKESDSALGEMFALHVDSMEFSPVVQKGSLPPPQSSHFSCVTGKKMFVFCNHGGINDFGLFILEYSGRFALWSLTPRLGDMPQGIYGATINLWQDKLIVFGGVVKEEFVDDLYVFDLTTHHWTHVTASSNDKNNLITLAGEQRPIPTARHIGINFDSKILYFGGAGNRLDATWELHLS